MSQSQQISIGEILGMAPGTKENASWINADFEAIISNVRRSQGRGPTKATLTDPHNQGNTIEGSFFGTDPSRFNGKICRFSGNGMTRTEYKGVDEITIGAKVAVRPIGGAAPVPQASRQAAPATRSQQPAQGSASLPTLGATVGMAINNAVALIVASGETTSAYLESVQFSRDVHMLASDIIRVSRVLERGNLAEPAKTRADQQPEPEPAPPVQQHHEEPSQEHPPEEIQDDDIPF